MFRRHAMVVVVMAALLGAVAAWACKPPGDIAGFAVQATTHRTATIRFDAPARGAVAIRVLPIPVSWGEAMESKCMSSPCVVDGLDPSTAYTVQAIPYLVTQTNGTIYGSATPTVVVTTQPVVKLKDAVHDAVEYCLGRKLAHTACFRALDEALGKVNE